MKVEVTEAGEWRRTIEVEVPAEDLEKRFDTSYRSYSKSLNIPGFRKGRVPIALVKKRFGKAIQGEVLQEAMQEFLREASRSEGLHPVSEATIEDVDFDEGAPLRFKATFEIKPELKVQNHKGMKVTRPFTPLKDDHISQHLKYLQNQNAAEQQVDRPAAVGDVLSADIQEVDEGGIPLVGRSQEDQTFLLGGPDGKTNELDEQLLGITAGEERRVMLTHSDDEQAGQEVRFQVKAKEVRERQLPELDDEFAKDVGDYESLDKLEERIRENFQARADYMSKSRLEENIVDALIRENDFEVPESMVANYLDSVVESAKKQHEDHDHEIDEEQIRNANRDNAYRSIRRYLLLEAVAKQESLEVTDEDERARVERMAENYNIDGDRMRQMLDRTGQFDRLRSELLEERTLAFLIEQANVEDVEVEEPGADPPAA